MDPQFRDRQRRIVRDHLEFYRQVFPRPGREAYAAHKRKHVIPKLHAALRRIEDETCGICADCGEEIDRRRLEQVPGALRCTGCQRRYETGIQPS